MKSTDAITHEPRERSVIERERVLIDDDQHLSDASRNLRDLHFEIFGCKIFCVYFFPREEIFGGFVSASGIFSIIRRTSD